jgi:L-alanine-DL-glutamate epimerase-like enolase superfamily enzyme
MELTWGRIELRLRHPFVTAAAVRTDKQTLWVRLRHDGIEGWGEAVPVDRYGQSLESAEAALARIASHLPERPEPIEPIIDRLLIEFDDQRATVAAVDAALHDWLARARGVSVVDLLGVRAADAPPTSFTLGIESPQALRARMDEVTAFPIWKVKIGTEAEAETLAMIRRHSPTRTLRVDANMGWRPDDALARLRRASEHGVELVEQPCRPNDVDTHGRLKRAGLRPIVADESCVRPADIPRIAGCFDGINIKLSKCGGIREARRMIDLARAHGLRVMLGCMIESSLGVAAAAQLAPLADWVDLDSHLLLADEPFEGLGGEGGRLTIGAGVGLGVRRRTNGR